MAMLRLPVHRIIPFSNVEGVGNRTSIFVQGCNANCLYCHNSETIPATHADARTYTIDELITEIRHNTPFIRGITVSGGEATLYPRSVKALFDEAHTLGLTCYIDTNGFFDLEKIGSLIGATDKFLYDIKGLGTHLGDLCFSDTIIAVNRARPVSGDQFVNLNQHVENLRHLLSMDKVEEIRLVYIKGFYNAEEVISTIADVIRDYPHANVFLKIIRVHARGLTKDRAKLIEGRIPSADEVTQLVAFAKSKNIQRIKQIL